MKVYVLTFNWYMGIDGSGSHVMGVFSTEDKVKEAWEGFLKSNTLYDEEYNSEWLAIEDYDMDVMEGISNAEQVDA